MTKRTNWLVAVAVILVVGGLLYFGVNRRRAVQEPSLTSGSQAASLVTEGEYPIGGNLTRFREGRAEALITLGENAPALKVSYELRSVTGGELDGESGEDAAAILGTVSDSKWHAQSLAVFRNNGGKMEYAGEAFLGDRIVVQSLDIKDGVITVNILTHGPDDYLDDPTLLRTLKFKLSNGLVVEAR